MKNNTENPFDQGSQPRKMIIIIKSTRFTLPTLRLALGIIFLLTLGLLAFPASSKAQLLKDPAFRERALQGLDHMYNMRFKAAEAHFKAMSAENPNLPDPHLLLAMNYYFQIVLCEKFTDLDEVTYRAIDKAIELNKPYETAPEWATQYNFIEFMVWGLKVRMEATRANWVRAVSAASKVFSPLKWAQKNNPPEKDFLFMQGLYNYYIVKYPERKPIVKPLIGLFPEGDATKGIEQLKQAFSGRTVTRGEVGYYLTQVYSLYEKDFTSALWVTTELTRLYPENTYFQLEHGVALYQNSKKKEGIRVLNDLAKQFESIPGHLEKPVTFMHSKITSQMMTTVYHYLGRYAWEEMGQSQLALQYFSKSRTAGRLALWEETETEVANVYYTGLCFAKNSRQDLADAQFRQVLKMSRNENYKGLARKCIDESNVPD